MRRLDICHFMRNDCAQIEYWHYILLLFVKIDGLLLKTYESLFHNKLEFCQFKTDQIFLFLHCREMIHHADGQVAKTLVLLTSHLPFLQFEVCFQLSEFGFAFLDFLQS